MTTGITGARGEAPSARLRTAGCLAPPKGCERCIVARCGGGPGSCSGLSSVVLCWLW